MDERRPLPPTRAQWVAGALIVALAAGLAFEPAWRNQLMRDDFVIVRNVQSFPGPGGWLRESIQPWFPKSFGTPDWRPFARLTLAVQKGLMQGSGSASVWPYFVFNIAAHAGVCILLFAAAIRWRLDPRAALAGSLLFAAHPLHAEAVNQIVGRTELLAAFWMLAGLILWTRWGPWTPHAFWQQPLVFALALGSKEHAVFYPLYLALAMLAVPISGPTGASSEDWGWGRLFGAGRRPARLLALFALMGIVLVAFFAARRMQTGGLLPGSAVIPLRENMLAHLPGPSRIAGAFGGLGYAAAHLLWPSALSPDYTAFSLPYALGWRWPYAWAGAGLFVLAIVGAVFDAKRGGRGWLLAAGGLAGWLLTSNIPFVMGTSPAPRLWYWPSAAACLGLGWMAVRVLDRLPERLGRLAAPVAAAAATALLLRVAWDNAIQWRDIRSTAESTLALFPDSWNGLLELSAADFEAGDYKSGRRHAQSAIRLIPADGSAYYWLGMNLLLLGDRESEAEAETAFHRSLDLGPIQAGAYIGLAMLYHRQGRLAETRAILAEGKDKGLVPDDSAERILSGMFDRRQPAGAAPPPGLGSPGGGD